MRGYTSRLINWIFKGLPEVKVTTKLYTLRPNEELKGKCILITGGSAGLGLSIAERYIQEGAEIIITGRDINKLEKAKEKLGSHCNIIQFDNGNTDKLDLFIDEIYRYGKLDGIVCNAGISLHEESFFDVTPEKWDLQFDINLKGTFFLIQKILEKRKEEKEFNVLIISSERGMQCDVIPYGLTKAGLNSLTRGLSRMFYKDNVRVNAIAPGVTASDMTGIDENSNLYQPIISSGRYFVPSEVAEVALFLMSDRSKCISGEIIATDAGNYLSSYF